METCLARMCWQSCYRSLPFAAVIAPAPSVSRGHAVECVWDVRVARAAWDLNTFVRESSCLDPAVLASSTVEGGPVAGPRYRRKTEVQNRTHERVVACLPGSHDATQVRA